MRWVLLPFLLFLQVETAGAGVFEALIASGACRLYAHFSPSYLHSEEHQRRVLAADRTLRPHGSFEYDGWAAVRVEETREGPVYVIAITGDVNRGIEELAKGRDPRFIDHLGNGAFRMPHPYTLNKRLNLEPGKSSIYFVPGRHFASDDSYIRAISHGEIPVSMGKDFLHDMRDHAEAFYRLSQLPVWKKTKDSLQFLFTHRSSFDWIKRREANELLGAFREHMETYSGTFSIVLSYREANFVSPAQLLLQDWVQELEKTIAKVDALRPAAATPRGAP